MTKRVSKKSNAPLIAVFIAILLVVMVVEYFTITSLQDNKAQTQKEEVHAMADDSAVSALVLVPEAASATPIPTTTKIPTTAAKQTPKPSKDPNALPIVLDKTYTIEDSGDEIVFIQQMLIDLGFDPGEADGVYGEMLSKAIYDFQLYADIDTDGIAGPNTISLLADKWKAAQTVPVSGSQPLRGVVIGIDPGHQRHSNKDPEPISPNDSKTKKKVSSGTYGRFSGVREYVINLQVGLKLKRELEMLGAKVMMTREVHGVDISNSERAKMMSKADVDCWLRIHANGSDNEDVHGMFIIIPSPGSMNTADDSITAQSKTLAEYLLDSTVVSTDAKDLGLSVRSDQTGFCWSSVPVCNIEMGHMTNEREDYLLVSEAYQQKIVAGLISGFVAYFDSAD